MPLLRPFHYENKDDAWKVNCLDSYSMLYPKNIFRFIRPVKVISKRINGNISGVPHRNFFFLILKIPFILDICNIKYEWFLQESQMACVFGIKISIYIVCTVHIKIKINFLLWYTYWNKPWAVSMNNLFPWTRRALEASLCSLSRYNWAARDLYFSWVSAVSQWCFLKKAFWKNKNQLIN